MYYFTARDKWSEREWTVLNIVLERYHQGREKLILERPMLADQDSDLMEITETLKDEILNPVNNSQSNENTNDSNETLVTI